MNNTRGESRFSRLGEGKPLATKTQLRGLPLGPRTQLHDTNAERQWRPLNSQQEYMHNTQQNYSYIVFILKFSCTLDVFSNIIIVKYKSFRLIYQSTPCSLAKLLFPSECLTVLLPTAAARGKRGTFTSLVSLLPNTTNSECKTKKNTFYKRRYTISFCINVGQVVTSLNL